MRSRILLLLSASVFLAFVGVEPEDLARTPSASSSDSAHEGSAARAPTSAPLLVAEAAAEPVEVETLESRAATMVDEALFAILPHIREQSDPQAVRYAFRAYFNYKLTHPERVRKPYFYYVDYGLDSETPRGYVFDMESLRIVEGPFHVAHGRGSVTRESVLPLRFLNKQDSNATSLGLYVAEETYGFRGRAGGRPYRSIGLRLEGVSGRFNSAARARGIVVHGAPYVTSTRAGLSEGCPAMEQHLAEKLIPQIAEGGMVFHFSPRDQTWLREDPWLLPGVPAGRA